MLHRPVTSPKRTLPIYLYVLQDKPPQLLIGVICHRGYLLLSVRWVICTVLGHCQRLLSQTHLAVESKLRSERRHTCTISAGNLRSRFSKVVSLSLCYTTLHYAVK